MVASRSGLHASVKFCRKAGLTAVSCSPFRVPAECRFSESLTFHRLDGEKFLRMMAACKAVVCTAGFESVSEAAYLGKPPFLVPVENHVEQQINAVDARSCGFGMPGTWDNLDPLLTLPARLSNTVFRGWLQQAQPKLLRALDAAVGRNLRSAAGGPAWPPPRASSAPPLPTR